MSRQSPGYVCKALSIAPKYDLLNLFISLGQTTIWRLLALSFLQRYLRKVELRVYRAPRHRLSLWRGEDGICPHCVTVHDAA